MSNPNSIFTKTRLGVDVRVWLTLFFVSLICAAILAFKISTTVTCVPFNITFSSTNDAKKSSYYIGETVIFNVAASAQKVTWDFGDNSKPGEGARVKHSFIKVGSYPVTATLNGKCTQTITVNIKPITSEKTISIDSVKIDAINGPAAPNAGEPVNYVCAVQAGSYEWMIVNSPNYNIQTTNVATYNFPTVGTRTIELRLDHDPKKVFRKTIVVIPSEKADQNKPAQIVVPHVVIPPKPKPAAPQNQPQPAQQQQAQPQVTPPPVVETKKVPPVIPNELLQGVFEDVIAGKQDVQSLNTYLCNGLDTKVFANGQLETVQSICSKLHGKKYIIKSVTADRDDKKCITVIHLDYKKKGFF